MINRGRSQSVPCLSCYLLQETVHSCQNVSFPIQYLDITLGRCLQHFPKPCVDKKDTSKKRRNKIIQCERKDRFAMSKARKSWIFQNGLSFQKFYAPEMQKPPFADGVNSLSTTPGATGKVRLLWGICISRHCYICFVCLWLFGSNGNSFRYAFRLYLLYQRREGEREWQPRANTLISR